jgi:hypothetical protein
VTFSVAAAVARVNSIAVGIGNADAGSGVLVSKCREVPGIVVGASIQLARRTVTAKHISSRCKTNLQKPEWLAKCAGFSRLFKPCR